MNNPIRSLTALAVVAAAALSAHAQNIGVNDIVVGFRVGSGTVSTDFMVDAGQISTLMAPTMVETKIGSFASNLSSLSSTWLTATNGPNAVNWGAIGVQDLNTIFGTSVMNSVAGTLGVQNSPDRWTVINATSIANGNVKIQALETLANSVNGFTGPSGTIPKSDTNSFTSQTTAGVAFGVFNSPTGTLTTRANVLATGKAYSGLDLYSVVGNAGPSTFLGTLALYNSAANGFFAGDLTFTAIPEPSTYAGLLGLATLGCIMIRRRQKASAV